MEEIGKVPSERKPINSFYEHRGLLTLGHFVNGSRIVINLIGQSIVGIPIEPDQSITGIMTDSRRILIDVDMAPHQPQLVNRTIGIGVCSELATPGGNVYTTLKSCVSPKRTFAYYYPEDIDTKSNYEIPKTYHYLAALYGRIAVGGKTVFDELENE